MIGHYEPLRASPRQRVGIHVHYGGLALHDSMTMSMVAQVSMTEKHRCHGGHIVMPKRNQTDGWDFE
eukprot:5905611-Amphidinium_carterae.1